MRFPDVQCITRPDVLSMHLGEGRFLNLSIHGSFGMAGALSHLNVRCQTCHREEGALRPTWRSHAVDWAAASGLTAMRLLRSARNDKDVS